MDGFWVLVSSCTLIIILWFAHRMGFFSKELDLNKKGMFRKWLKEKINDDAMDECDKLDYQRMWEQLKAVLNKNELFIHDPQNLKTLYLMRELEYESTRRMNSLKGLRL
jgi:hypothetical protein